jgi:hypothetical protein
MTLLRHEYLGEAAVLITLLCTNLHPSTQFLRRHHSISLLE